MNDDMGSDSAPKVAVVTGASSGIGRATATALAGAGYHVHAAARRHERVEELATHIGGTAHQLDVTDPGAVERFAATVPAADVLVNCAGGARGGTTVLEADIDQWRWMWETNVLGTLLVTKALAPKMLASPAPAVVTVTSVAAFEPLNNSSGYSASKHAQSVIHQTLRGELLGTPLRLIEICPGIVETEFFEQRYPDDPGRARGMFDGIKALEATDVARVITFAVGQPPYVNLDRIVMRPLAQAGHGKFHRQ